MQQPLISIIIPVYNAEKFIRQCLESVINQTYSNLEVICINDGSLDNSIGILKEYKMKDNRIVIIDKQNEGVSEARNTGINFATGDFIMFVDSDDWIDGTTCEDAIKAINRYNSDICFFNYVREFIDRGKVRIIFTEKEKYFNKKECKDVLCKRIIGLSGEELRYPDTIDIISPFWGKLYKSELIKNNDIKIVSLSEICTCEDGLFNISAFYHANSAVYINKPLYHYRKYNANSIITSYKENLFSGWQNLFDYMRNFIHSNDCDNTFNCALYNRIAISLIALGLNIVSSKKSHKDKVKDIALILKNHNFIEAYKKLSFRYFPIHWKVFFLCAKFKCATCIYVLLCIIKQMIGK